MGIIVLVAAVGIVVWLSRRARNAVSAPAEVGPVGWAGGTRWAVARPLARAETRRLLRHPAFVVGAALTPLMLWAAIGSEAETAWWRVSTSAALALVPLGWATIVAANLLALQPRRTGAHELLSAAPAPQPVRSAGLLLGAVPAAAVAAALVVAGLIALGGGSGDFTGLPLPVEMAAGLLIVAGSVTVGVGVARWLPHLGFGILAAVATAFIQARFFELSAWPWYRTEADPLRFLGFLAGPTSVTVPSLEIRPAGWHLVYLFGLVLVMAGVALARDGVPRLLAVPLAAAVLLTATAGWVQLRPPTDERVVELIASLNDPISHQTCAQDATVRYCAPDDELGRVGDWRARVTAVQALVPAPVATRPLEVSYRVPTVTGNSNCAPQPFFDGLHPAVVGKLSAAGVWPDDGAVHPGTDRFPCGGDRTDELFTAVQVGSWAVGLPASPHHLDVRCSATGQARAAVALWLGAAATPGGGRTLRALVAERTTVAGVMTFAEWDDPPMWGVRFATADAELALRMLAVPKERVAEALAGAWDDVVAPRTTSAELAGLVGVAAPAAAPAPAATAAGPVCP
ncbi:MAG: hypothetical protein ACR2MO_07860 [Acidimicrobiales bacterium]